MLCPQRLMEFLEAKLKVRRGDGLVFTGAGSSARLNGISIATINEKLTQGTRNLKVSSDHRMAGDRPLKEYVVRGLDTCPCSAARFQEVCGACQRCGDATISRRAPIEQRCEQPRWTTVAEWFARDFPQHRLRWPGLPCVLVGSQADPGKVKLPLELLKILPGQPMQENGSEVLQDMIKHTAITPDRRFPIIQQVVDQEYAPSQGTQRLSEHFESTTRRARTAIHPVCALTIVCVVLCCASACGSAPHGDHRPRAQEMHPGLRQQQSAVPS